MKTSWKAMLKGANMRVQDSEVEVLFEQGRSHKVRIEETPDTIEIHAIVAKATTVKNVPDLPLQLWRMNRAAQLVSFRLDARSRVCARGWVPKADLTADEFQQVVRRVASEADRLEFVLTGEDVE